MDAPDGKVLASGSNDKTIKLWDVANGSELRSLNGHTSAVNSVAFSPDGKVLASSGYDDAIRCWDVASGREQRTLSNHMGRVSSVAVSPDGRVLASGSLDDAPIKLWDFDSGRELRSLSGHYINSVAFSPDGRMLASGGNDATVRLWDLASGSEPRIMSGDSKSILVADFRTFNWRCDPATSGPQSPLPQSCANELVELTRRRQQLQLTDADLRAALAATAARRRQR